MAVIQRQMDEHVTVRQQLQDSADGGPVTLINFITAPAHLTQGFLDVWLEGASYQQATPGFISGRLYRGTSGSTTWVNVAHWESPAVMRNTFESKAIQGVMARFPEGVLNGPHLFRVYREFAPVTKERK